MLKRLCLILILIFFTFSCSKSYSEIESEILSISIQDTEKENIIVLKQLDNLEMDIVSLFKKIGKNNDDIQQIEEEAESLNQLFYQISNKKALVLLSLIVANPDAGNAMYSDFFSYANDIPYEKAIEVLNLYKKQYPQDVESHDEAFGNILMFQIVVTDNIDQLLFYLSLYMEIEHPPFPISHLIQSFPKEDFSELDQKKFNQFLEDNQLALSLFMADSDSESSNQIGNIINFEFFDYQTKNEILLSDFKGQWIVLDFWATWCSPCVDKIPEIRRLYNQYKDKNVVFISISADSEEKVFRKIINKEKMNWFHWFSPDEVADLSQKLGIVYIPSIIILDQEGRIVKTEAVDTLESDLIELIH